MMVVMKKQQVIALALLLAIPVVAFLGVGLSNLINPEIAAGHPNYVRNFHLLSLVKQFLFFATGGAIAILWFVASLLVIRSKERSPYWILLAILGPFGFAILSMLNDRTPTEADHYTKFVRKMNAFLRVGYEVLLFVVIWEVAYWAMVLKRNLMITIESARTGMSIQQIIDIQNQSSGMWAFGEALEVIFLAVLLYLLWPIVFNLVGRVAAFAAPSKPR
jgi:hypothetical protein